jgi:hypothetical protein
LQEHWLSSDSLRNFDYFNKDYKTYSSSAMDDSVRQGMLRGRRFKPLNVFGMKLNKNFIVAVIP